ncbi:SEC-C metal-binding domain-containing protein [Salibacterium aidingense]|uniref:SEC-C metal-binding domain-containing protein n=1 Tax=Salibacterium aidingense TaxID=384933 RepID=UPI003BE06E55
MQIGRNEPCPCGSGKKYKKCCGNNKITPITYTPGQIHDFMQRTYHYALTHYIQEFEDYMADLYSGDVFESLSDEELNVLSILTAAYWLFEKNNQEKYGSIDRILQASSWNAREQRLLEKWKEEAVFSLFALEEKNEWTATATDLQNRNSYDVKLPVDSFEEYDKEISFICLVPVQDQWYMFGVPFVTATADDSETFHRYQSVMKDLIQTAQNQRPRKEPFISMIHEFLSIILPVQDNSPSPVPDTETDLTPEEQQVLAVFNEKADNTLQARGGVEYGEKLWTAYANTAAPIIKKPAAYAAALDYYLCKDIYQLPGVTQKKIGEKYGVAPGTISARSLEMDKVLADLNGSHDPGPSSTNINIEMERMMFIITKEIERLGLSTAEEIQSFQQTFQLDNAAVEQWSEEDQQQLRLYDAMLEPDPHRRQELLQENLHQNKAQTDVYLQLMERSEDPEDTLMYARQAVEAGAGNWGILFSTKTKEISGH